MLLLPSWAPLVGHVASALALGIIMLVACVQNVGFASAFVACVVAACVWLLDALRGEPAANRGSLMLVHLMPCLLLLQVQPLVSQML